MVGSGAYPRLIGSFVALGAGAAAVVFGVLLVRGLPAIATQASSSIAGSGSPTTSSAPGQSRAFPAPPAGAVVFGSNAGETAVGLAVLHGQGQTALRASVLDINGKGVRGLSVRFDVAGAGGQKIRATGVPCGRGCYRAAVKLARPTSVNVQLSGERPLFFAMPAAWPAPSAAGIIRLAGETWRNLRTLAWRDRLSDGKVGLETDYEVIHPDRLKLQLQKIITPDNKYKNAKNLDAQVIIGDKEWDKPRGATRWLTSDRSLRITQPVPYWQSATNAYLLGTVSYHGRPAWKVSFYDGPGGPGWSTVIVEKATMHTVEMWMTAPDHFMHNTYHSFDAPLTIVPPSSS